MAGILSVLSDALGRGDDLKKFDLLRMETLGRWGNATAALTCTQVGGIPSLPERNRVMNLLMSI
jgi:sugar/nucleoside kinase (ribokinase family)